MRLSRGTDRRMANASAAMLCELHLSPKGTDILLFLLRFVVLCTTAPIVLTSVRS